MLDARGLRRVGEVLAVCDLLVVAVLPEVGHRQDAVDAGDRRPERRRIAEVALDHLDAFGGQLLRALRLRVARQRAHAVAALEEGAHGARELLPDARSRSDEQPATMASTRGTATRQVDTPRW